MPRPQELISVLQREIDNFCKVGMLSNDHSETKWENHKFHQDTVLHQLTRLD